MLLTFQLVISEAEMRLTWKSSLKSHLSYLNMIHIALIVLAQVEESLANCYTSPVMVPTIGQTKHVEISIHPGEQIISLQESIEQLKNELSFEKSSAPLFLAVLCLAGWDLSETRFIPEEKTIYAAFLMPKTSYVLMASEEGIAQILPFDSFKDLILQQFELSITPVMSNTLQVLTSDQGLFSFKSHTTNSEQFSIIPNACIKQLGDIFQILINQESHLLRQLLQLRQLTGGIGQDRRSIIEMFLRPSTSSIQAKGIAALKQKLLKRAPIYH